MRNKMFFLLVVVATLSFSGILFAGEEGFVRMYEDKGFNGRTVVSKFKQDIFDMHREGLNDKVSSLEYEIPEGWMVVLHADVAFRGRKYTIQGSGKVRNISKFNDKCSSVEWKRHP